MSKKSMNTKKVKNLHLELIPLREVALEDFVALIGAGVKMVALPCTKWVCHYNLNGDVSGHLFVHDWTDVVDHVDCEPYKIKAKVRGNNKTLAEQEYFVSSYKEAKEAIYKAKKFLAKYVDDPRLTEFK